MNDTRLCFFLQDGNRLRNSGICLLLSGIRLRVNAERVSGIDGFVTHE